VDYAEVTKLIDGESQCRAIDANIPAEGTARYPTKRPVGNAPWAFANAEREQLCERLQQAGPALNVVAEVFVGVQTSADKIYHLDVLKRTQRETRVRCRLDGTGDRLENDLLRPLVSGEDVKPYWLNTNRQVILYPYEWVNSRSVPLIPWQQIEALGQTKNYLEKHQDRMRGRENGKFDDGAWYRFGRSQNIGRQRGAKLCIPRLAPRIRCGFDQTGDLCLDNVDVNAVRIHAEYAKVVDYYYLCGILNSELIDVFVKSRSRYHFRGGFASYNRQFIKAIPIKIPKTKAEKETARMISERVQRAIQLWSQLQNQEGDHERSRTEREIESQGAAISSLVLRVYGIDTIPAG
jgi:hypothetical protein